MKRFGALDLLRGLSIFGMVFSAIIPSGVLPGWMYHIQNPPPSHELNLTATGLSWVDLVFPVFIFCMGVAIPLAGVKKPIAIFERFLSLWLFSYLYLFLNYGDINSVWAQLLTIAGFLALFPVYMIIKDYKYKIVIRLAGFLFVAAIIFAGNHFFGEVISIHRSGIIIFLLAFLYLFTALIWHFTRDKFKIRVSVFVLVLLFSMISMHYDLQQKLYAVESLRWLINLEYIYFLLISIPATWLGDVLIKRFKQAYSGNTTGNSAGSYADNMALAALSFILVVWNCFAFYEKLFWINFVISAIILNIIYLIIKKRQISILPEFIVTSVALIAGIFIAQIEGGIQKVPATISYCLVTFSSGLLLLWSASYIIAKFENTFIVKILKGAGGNPLMSYVAYGGIMIPLFKVTGFIIIYKACFPHDSPWIGVAASAFFVLLMSYGVSLLTTKKIVWRA